MKEQPVVDETKNIPMQESDNNVMNEENKKKNDHLNKQGMSNCMGCSQVVKKTLNCPICLKQNKKSVFCSQECFKANWKEHQKLHKQEETKNAVVSKEKKEKEQDDTEKLKELIRKNLSPEHYNPNNKLFWMYDNHLRNFIDFKFTGKIRPWPITKMKTVPDHIEKPDYALTSIPKSELNEKNSKGIYVNTEEEIERIREACLLGRKALDYAHSLVKPNVTTDEIDSKVHDFIIKHNAYPSPLNYYKFPKSCCTSVNEIVCHGIPDLRPLQEGDIINIDISLYYKGMHADLNETYFVGSPEKVPPKTRELVETTYFSLMEAIKRCKPGEMYRNLGNTIQSFVTRKNFSVVRTYSGHGVGKLFHSNPSIPHYKKNKTVGFMKQGHVFTIEPMINEGNFDDVLWPDNWTSATIDGKMSAQFEHTLLITKDGVEVLTKRLEDSPPLGFDTKDELYFPNTK